MPKKASTEKPATTKKPALQKPVRQKKAKLDNDGLTRLGLDRLVSLVLEETETNKALKARLSSALAGLTGPAEAAKLVDRRLAAIEKGRSYVQGVKARQLTDDLASLLKSILSDIAEYDAPMGFERLWRFLLMQDDIRYRFYTASPRVEKIFEDARQSLVVITGKMDAGTQKTVVASLDAVLEKGSLEGGRYIAAALVPVLQPAVLESWQMQLQKRLASRTDVKGRMSSGYLVDLLQIIALKKGELDHYIALERTRPETGRDPLKCAGLLLEAGRHAEALEWARTRRMLIARMDHDGTILNADSLYARDLGRVRLEASILDAMKDRKAAQAVRWQGFEATLDAALLKEYIAKADDFTEFEELDKAFAFAARSKDIYAALLLFVDWPKLDLAQQYVIDNMTKWDGRHYSILVVAADALGESHPVGATILFRTLVSDILDRGLSSAYHYAAVYYSALAHLAPLLPEDLPFPTPGAYALELEKKHGRKYGFWSLLAAL